MKLHCLILLALLVNGVIDKNGVPVLWFAAARGKCRFVEINDGLSLPQIVAVSLPAFLSVVGKSERKIVATF